MKFVKHLDKLLMEEYKVVDSTPENYDVRRYGEPILVLEDEYGGQSVITTDDGCLILMNGSDDREFQNVYHWHREVVLALGELLSETDLSGRLEE